MPQRPQPSLRLADGGNFVTRWAQNVMRPKNTEQRLRQIEAPPPAPVARPAPPPPPNATPDNPAGIRFQDGGHVPGTGKGDKIPAKYEPGEFVVSNDMIDDNPGLREQLASLRADTLAARGKTVEEADAKALRYHGGLRGGEYGQGTDEREAAQHADVEMRGRGVRQGAAGTGGGGVRGGDGTPAEDGVPARGRVTLRAADGFDPLGRMARDLTGQNSLPPKTPVGNMADDLARNARAAPPAPPPGPSNPGMGNPQARAAYAEMTRGSAPAAAPTAPTASTGPGAAYGAARQAGQAAGAAKDWALGSRPAATTVLGKVKNTGGAAATAAGRIVGGLQVADTLRNNFDAMQNLARDENSGVSDYLAGGVEFIGNTVASGGAALSSKFPRLGPLAAGFIGSDGASRFIDKMDPGASVLRRHGLGGESKVPGASVVPGLTKAAQMVSPTPGSGPAPAAPTTQNTLSNPYANATPEQGRAMAEVNRTAAQPAAPGGGGGPADSGGIRRIDRPGQSPLFTNVADDAPLIGNNALMARGSGPNAQNMAAGDALAARQQTESMARVQGGMGGGGGSAPQMPQAPTVRHSGNDWQARNDLRNAMVSATSITNDGGKWDKHKGVSPERAYAAGLAETDAKLRGAQPGVDVATLQSNNSLRGSLASADASRYGSDNSLRGQVYSADSSRAGQMATARSKQQELAYNRQRDALKDSMDIEKHNQTISHNATSNARDRLKGMAVRDDGKGGTVVDEGRLARLESTLTKMSPGWAQSGEATQAGLLRKAEASVNILEGLNNQRNNGWLQAFGIDGKSAQLDNLPHKEMKGAKLSEVGFVDGVTTPGTSRKDYVIETSGGHKLYLPRSSVNQGELELLKSLGVDVAGSKK